MELCMRNYVAGADYGEVYRLFVDPVVNHMIINKPDHNNMGTFSKWLEHHLNTDFHDFMVFRTVEDDFVGFAYSYDFNPMDGHCMFTVAVKSQYQTTGAGGIVAMKFLNYLFTNYNLRKVYIHIYAYNTHSRQCVEAFGFCSEGTLCEYRYFNGRFEDLWIYAVTRDVFYNTVKQRLASVADVI